MAAKNATVRPKFLGAFKFDNGCDITVIGIEMDGRVVTPPRSYAFGMDDKDMTFKNVKVYDVYAHNYARCFIRGDRAKTLVCDSVIVDKLVFNDNTLYNYALFLFKTLKFQVLKITNSTLSNIGSQAVRVNIDADHGVILDHVTIFNYSTYDKTVALFQDDGAVSSTGTWTVTNCIMAFRKDLTKNAYKFASGASVTLTNCCLWNIGVEDYKTCFASVKDTIHVNPQFADTSKQDFTLPAGSKLLTYGTDKKAIGDPRWAGAGTAVEPVKVESMPAGFALCQNYPNPFNPSTNINFYLYKDSRVRLTILNTAGQEVATILNCCLRAGQNTVTFNADGLPAGVYFYGLTTPDQIQYKKMVLMK
jgi:hypothetical protein